MGGSVQEMNERFQTNLWTTNLVKELTPISLLALQFANMSRLVESQQTWIEVCLGLLPFSRPHPLLLLSVSPVPGHLKLT